MSETYKAIEVRKPGEFAEVRRPLQDPAHDQVRIRVEACGVCHSDAATVEGGFPGITYPRVPGHEVVGCIDAVGSGVRGWQLGQRVGVGFLAGSCGYCEFCRGGDLVNCQNQENRRRSAPFQRPERSLRDERNGPARTSSGRLREDDVWQGALSHGPDDGTVRIPIATTPLGA